jgi:SNF2 family DNA or RNA helicase
VNASDEPFIVWVKQNEEADLMRSLIPDAVEVRGNETPEQKEKKLLGFAAGEFRVLLTKTKIAQFGLNYQHCHNQVFASLDFSFEGLYQAIRRSYRFGQTHPVNIYLITTDTMQNVIDSIRTKESQFQEMQKQMIAASREYSGGELDAMSAN